MVEFHDLSVYPSLSIHDQAKRRLNGVEMSSASVHVYNTNMERRVFGMEELAGHDGVQDPAYVAYLGKVYDVSGSFPWQKCNHQGLHRAGRDLTEAFSDAPHGVEFPEGFPAVAILGDR
jgi:predicted heme/steroid binding protein